MVVFEVGVEVRFSPNLGDDVGRTGAGCRGSIRGGCRKRVSDNAVKERGVDVG